MGAFILLAVFIFIHRIGHENVLISNVIISQMAVGLLRYEEERRGNKLRIHIKIKRKRKYEKRVWDKGTYVDDQ